MTLSFARTEALRRANALRQPYVVVRVFGSIDPDGFMVLREGYAAPSHIETVGRPIEPQDRR